MYELERTRLNKPVSTLAIVPRSGSMTRLGRQTYDIMMFVAKEQRAEDAETGTFGCPVSELVRGMDGSMQSTRELKRHLRSMVTHVVEWQSPTPGETAEWGACTLLAQVQLVRRKGEDWVRWAYPPIVRDELMNPQRFAQLNRATIARFRTHAGLALYEICARYKDNPAHLTSKQHWTWWVPVLTGKPKQEKTRTQFRFFNRDTLKPAIKEVNEFSEINVELIEDKRGRSIENLQFRVTSKTELRFHRPAPIELGKVIRATELGISSDIAEDLMVTHGPEVFAQAVNRLEDRVQNPQAAPVRSRLAYLRTIIEDLHNTSGRARPPRDKADVIDVPARTLDSGNAVREKEPADDFVDVRIRIARAEISDLPANERAELLDELRATFRNGELSAQAEERLRQGVWESGLVLGKLVNLYWTKTRGIGLSEIGPEELHVA